ncbi:AMP-binding protein [Mesorhizobium sp. SB112]|uniref:phenylacetate--CoA ligase family protein n=1 Tax=Mesorhizobium sp. SB112 TaxID=3151853 RepID=UPI003263EBE1
MTAHFDPAEIRDPAEREQALFAKLPEFLSSAKMRIPAFANRLQGHDPQGFNSRKALAALPVLRKSELMELQAQTPPFGGLADPTMINGGRAFLSPGPLWEPQGVGIDAWSSARAFHAAGIRPGDIVHNAFSYHMTPGGFIMDEGARALGCVVFPAGTGNTDMHVEAIEGLKPGAYCGTPDFLKIILDRAAEQGKDVSSIRLGLVSGGALFPSLRTEYRERGINVLQCYATAEFGVIAYESATADGTPNPGMVLNEDLILEIVRPGTNDPVADGEVGEVVVTNFNPVYPMVRLGTGDLSKVLDGPSPCGRTNTRIAGWMGRADQRTKIKGMFVDPKQIAEIVTRHPEITRARLVVTRDGEADAMALHVEAQDSGGSLSAIEASLREITKLGGKVHAVTPGALPNDGKVISDERDYERG